MKAHPDPTGLSGLRGQSVDLEGNPRRSAADITSGSLQIRFGRRGVSAPRPASMETSGVGRIGRLVITSLRHRDRLATGKVRVFPDELRDGGADLVGAVLLDVLD